MRSFLCTVLLSLMVAGMAVGQELHLERAIGLEESGPIYFIHPYDVAWGPGGRAFVLSGSDAKIAVFSSQWEYLSSFAGKGGAPGELNSPSMLLVVGSELWVKVPRGAEVFDTGGNYLRLVRMPNDVGSIQVVGGDLIGTASHSGGIGVVLDAKGDVQSSFGPKPPEFREMLDFMRGLSWSILSDGDDHCILLDTFDGQVWRFGADFERSAKVDLGLGRGESTGSASFKKVVSDACRDPHGGYFVIHYGKAKGRGHLYHYDEAWEQDGRWEIPEEANAGMVRVTPNSNICLISESGSVLYIFERPRILGEQGD